MRKIKPRSGIKKEKGVLSKMGEVLKEDIDKRKAERKAKAKPKEPKKYLIEVIRIDETQHKHTYHRTTNLFATIEDENEQGDKIKIKVEPKDLYEVKKYGWFMSRIKGLNSHYIMVVNSKGKAVSEKTPKVSGKVLTVARDWKGLGKAISDSFGSRLQMPSGIMVFLIAGAIVIIGVLLYTGYIPIPSRWSR